MSRLKPASASDTSLQAQELAAQQIPELPEQGRGGRWGAPDPACQVRRHTHLPNRGQKLWTVMTLSKALMPGRSAGGEEPEVHPRAQDHLLHYGGGQQRQAGHRPGRGLQALLGHAGRLLHLAPAPRVQGEAVRGEPWHHGLPRRQGAGQGGHQAHASVIQSRFITT